jgi:hypothetical protein
MTPFWMEREYRGGAPNVRAATLYVHGLRDFNVLPQTIRGWFDRLPASTPRKGLFGVWDHAEPDGHSVERDWQRGDWLPMLTAWYDRWLKGLSTGVESWPTVQVQDSTGRWRDEPRYPVEAGPAGQLALAPQGKLGTRTPSGETTFAEDDENGVTFTTDAVSGPLSLTGQPVLDLWLKSNKPDAHLAAEIEVLGKDGQPLEHSGGDAVATYGLRSLRHLDPISDGWFRQTEGRLPSTAGPIRVPIRFLPTDLVVPQGGKLRVRLSGRGVQPHEASSSNAHATITVLHGCERFSALRFLQADPAAPQLNVREQSEGAGALKSEPRAIGTQDGAGLASATVCEREAVAPDAVLARPDLLPPVRTATTSSTRTPAPPAAPAPAPSDTRAATPSRARCAAPESRFARGSSLRAGRVALRGTAAARGCRVRSVSVAVARKVGSRCRFLQRNGRFGAARSCRRARYVRARGTTRWSLTLGARLPRGAYVVWSRAVAEDGVVERKSARGNMLKRRVGRR